MKITFIQHCPACLASGWSEYAAGAKADLVRAPELVAVGIATEGWIKPQEAPQAPEIDEALNHTESEEESDSAVLTAATDVYADVSTKQLREACRDKKVWKRGMKRDAMIDALESYREWE